MENKAQKCPVCSITMEHKIRFRSGEAFWHCPNCEHVIDISPVVKDVVPSKKLDIVLTSEQKDIVQFAPGGKNIAINATAGSGKSSTLIKRALAQGASQAIFLAFNKDAAYSINEKLGLRYGPQQPRAGVSVTLHQVAWACLDPTLAVRALNKSTPEGRGEINEYGRQLTARLAAEFGGQTRNRGRGHSAGNRQKLLIKYMNACVQTLAVPGAAKPPLGDWRFVPLALQFLQTFRSDRVTSFDLVDLTFEYAMMSLTGMGNIEDAFSAEPLLEKVPHQLRGIKEVLVDEAQDLTPLQWKTVDTLAKALGASLAVCGDIDQGIYSFRFADVDEFLGRCEDTAYEQKNLSTNFRCAKQVIRAADKLIKHNVVRLPKTIIGSKEIEGEVKGITCWNYNDEARYIADTIRDEVDAGEKKYSDYAILSRTNAALTAIEFELFRNRIPASMVGTRSLMRREIRSIIDFMRLEKDRRAYSIASDPGTPVPALRALTMLPGVGAASVATALQNASKEIIADPLNELILVARGDHAKKRVAAAKALLERFENSTLSLDEKAIQIRDLFFEEGSKVLGNMDEGDAEEEDPRELVEPFISLCRTCDTLEDIEEFIFAIEDTDERNYVTLSTVHKAKGLEWNTVFIPHCVEGQFPHIYSLKDPSEAEGERRLFYVAMTRAEERLFFICPFITINDVRELGSPPSSYLGEAGSGDVFPIIDEMKEEKRAIAKKKIEKAKRAKQRRLLI